jgi:hypothetical protein
MTTFLTYYNFPTANLFYGEEGRIETEKNGRCCEEGSCEDFEWIKTYHSGFSDIPRWENTD